MSKKQETLCRSSPSTRVTLALFLSTSSSEIFQGQPCLISFTVASSLKPSFSLKGAMRSSNLLMLQHKQTVPRRRVWAGLGVLGGHREGGGDGYCSGRGFWLMSGRMWTSWKPRRNLLSRETILMEGKGHIFPKLARNGSSERDLLQQKPCCWHFGFSHSAATLISREMRQSCQVRAHSSHYGKAVRAQQDGKQLVVTTHGTVPVAKWLRGAAAASTYAFLSSSILLICPPTNTRILHFPHRFLRPRR